LKEKMIIGLDIDNTIAEYTSGLLEDIARQLNVDDMEAFHREYAPPVDYSMSNWPGFPDAFYGFHVKAVDRGLYARLKMIEGASDFLWKISDDGDHIRVITSRFVGHQRNSKVVRDTGIWLDDSNIPYRDIMFTSSKTDVYADVYVDDSPDNIINLRALGREVIIFDAPYNQGLPGRRAYTWAEVYAHLVELRQILAAKNG
jgi:5'(3')-deoxyribonucleotidase